MPSCDHRRCASESSQSFALPSQECKDARKYQEQGHYTDDNKQQEFTEEVWFHQLVSTHGPNLSAFPILSQLARKHDPVIPSIRGPQRWRIQGEILDCLDNGPQAHDWIW